MSAARASRPFLALLSAAQAIEQADPERLRVALDSVPDRSLRRMAARHRCLGYVYRGILENKLRTPSALAFIGALREHRAKAAMQAFAARKQLNEIVDVLHRAGIRFALLKGAARLFREDIEADWDLMCDFDILIEAANSGAAVTEFKALGYTSRPDAFDAPRHHHLSPLSPPHFGLAIELHTALAPRRVLSTQTSWQFCEPYFETVRAAEREAMCFDATGTALHLMIHGAGIRRLHDAIMLARFLRADSTLYEKLQVIADAERWSKVELQGVLFLGMRIAGLAAFARPQAERYVQWVMRREHLTPYIRARCQFVDAWYCNGGRPWGPATRAALPDHYEPKRTAWLVPFVYAGRVIGRIATSAYAAAAAPPVQNFSPWASR